MLHLIDSLTLIDSLVENKILGWIKISLRNLKVFINHLITSYVVVELSDNILIFQILFFFKIYFSLKEFIIFCLSPILWNFIEMCIKMDIFIYFVEIPLSNYYFSNLKKKISQNNFWQYPPIFPPPHCFSSSDLLFYLMNWSFNYLIFLLQHFMYFLNWDFSVCFAVRHYRGSMYSNNNSGPPSSFSGIYIQHLSIKLP